VLILVPSRVAAAYASGDPGAMALQALTLVTYGLVHVQTVHVFANLGFLLAFGSQCERQMGWRRYLALTLAATVAGGVAELLAVGDVTIAILGASAATSGMMGAFA
jgi:membrane associated rhomboid family serine protease